MTILIIADHDHQSLSDQSARAISAALKIGNTIDVLIAGKNAQSVADQASQIEGVTRVLWADSEQFAEMMPEPMTDLVMSVSDQYDIFIAPATSTGKNLMPRVAALLDVMQISDVIEVVDSTTFKRPIYAGNAIEVVQTNDAKCVLTVRGTSFETPEAKAQPAEIEAITPNLETSDLSKFLENKLSENDRPELTSAKIVVSGGRAVGSEENFQKIIYPLADKLGAAVGASRAAVDAGYAANDLQVGQTGKVVAPDIYIACGISGAIQHLAGMKDAKIIVAINKDEDAPIFQVADFGIVGDIFDVVPELESQI